MTKDAKNCDLLLPLKIEDFCSMESAEKVMLCGEASSDHESKSKCHPESVTPTVHSDGIAEEKRLGVVFDIDGTLIADNTRYCGIKVRPGAIDFIKWLRRQGHASSIWTKASGFWAHNVVTKICPLVSGPHECSGVTCRKTFDFVWCSEKCTIAKEPSLYWQRRYANAVVDIDDCKWCEVYGSTCHQCECMWEISQCPCRYTKDLRKVFGYSTHSTDKETRRFSRERTIIIEDTPQNCRYNYGNAIYVPTYKGHLLEDCVFTKLQSFFENELESCEDVRFVRKCDHGQLYHACYKQFWLTR